MNTLSILSLTLGFALVIGTSCNDSGGGRSTSIDSTNDMGTAPVQYQSGTPEATTDTSMQSVLPDKRARQDNSNNQSMQDAQGAGNNQGVQSNTTDPKTTSGSKPSANSGNNK